MSEPRSPHAFPVSTASASGPTGAGVEAGLPRDVPDPVSHWRGRLRRFGGRTGGDDSGIANDPGRADSNQCVQLPRQPVSRAEAIAIVIAALAILAVATFHLETYPVPWFDEGWFLQVPRNLVLFGQYATQSSEGFRYDDTVLTVSPTLYFPIAAAFKVAGIGLWPARMVVVGYLLLAVGGCYAFARSMHGPLVGVVAAYLFLFRAEDDPFTSTLYLGRMVMGEVPAVAFLLAGCLVWRRAVLRDQVWTAVAAGAVLGLATVTKMQFILLVPTALGLVAAAAWLMDRRREAWLAAVAAVASAATLGGWFVVLWAILGTAEASSLAANIVAASAPQVRVTSVAAMVRATGFIIQSAFLFLGIPALVYGLILERRSTDPDPGRRLLLALVVMSLTWYALRSIGWTRYAYPLMSLGSLLVAKFVIDLSLGIRTLLTGGADARRGAPAAAVAMLVMVLLLPVPGAVPILRGMMGPQNRDLPQLRQWIETHVPAGKVIETWDYEIVFSDTERVYHLPPVRLVDQMIVALNLPAPQAVEYDIARFTPDLIVVGRFGKWTGLYDSALGATTKVATFGVYDVYERVPGSTRAVTAPVR